jgi:DoxX-like protein
MTAAILIVFVVIATVAAILAAGHEEDVVAQGRVAWAHAIAYWLLTLLVAFEMAAGALWDLLRIEYVRVIFTHLGYPLYLLDILGVWKIPCALVLLVPRFARLKEWAYAGAFFDYTGAAASHLLAGDGSGEWVGPLVFAAFTLASWALRPPTRRLPRLRPATEIRAVTWYVPILIVAAMLVFAFFTLPKGAPPQ